MNLRKSTILKLAMFATGLSGIVAEYILSTLATYFLGDSVFQWTMTVSVMMFSMGLGSRISKSIENNLFRKFIYVEFLLSILVAFSSVIVYTATAWTTAVGIFIYVLSICVGLLIGMEIPLVIRINNAFESLKTNVSDVLEKDYYGSLVGGVFFGFVGLPIIGLTYTPYLLGMINFLVALSLVVTMRKDLVKKELKFLMRLASAVLLVILLGLVSAQSIVMYGEQKRYKDKIVYQEQSKYQKIVITQWKNNYWLYINGNEQLSSLDEPMYHEPLVHPVMKMNGHPQKVLVMGGGDGCAVRELLKYSSVERIDLVDLDPAMTNLGKNNPIIVTLNQGAMNSPKLHIHNEDGFNWLEKEKQKFFDVIIVDLPDPKTVELGRLYTYEFYRLCYRHLRGNGMLITQGGSPYYASKAFRCIQQTMHTAEFGVLPIHNQVLSLGEWGWIIGSKQMTDKELKDRSTALMFDDLETQWLNHEAMKLITSFGKEFYNKEAFEVEVNRIHNPVLYKYYLKGNWDLY